MADFSVQLGADLGVKPVRADISGGGGSSVAFGGLAALAQGLDYFTTLKQQKVKAKQDAIEEQRKQESHSMAVQRFQNEKQGWADAKETKAAVFDASVGAFDAINYPTSNDVQADPTLATDLSSQDSGDPTDPTSALFAGPSGAMPTQAEVDAARATSELGSVVAAVEQGSMPSISLPARINKKYLELIAQHPNDVDKINAVWKERGLDSFITRQATDEVKGYESERDVILKQQEEFYSLGSKILGPDAAGLSYAEIVDRGSREAKAQADFEWTAKKLNATQTSLNISKQEKEAATEESKIGLRSQLATYGYNLFADANKTIQGLAMVAMQLPAGERDAKLQAAYNMFETNLANFKARLLPQLVAARMGDSEIKAFWDTLEPSISQSRSLFKGDFSVSALRAGAMTSMTQALSIKAHQAAPVYMALENMGIGPKDIETMFLGAKNDGGLMDDLRKEVLGMQQDIGKERASSKLINIVRMLKGEKEIPDPSSAEFKQNFKTIVGVANNSINAYNKGVEVNPEIMLNGLGTAIIGSRTLNASSGVDYWSVATQTFAGVEARKALIKSLKDPAVNDLAEATIQGSRAASAQILDGMRKSFRSYDTKYWKLSANADGYIVSQFDTKQWEADAKNMQTTSVTMTVPGGQPNFARAMSKPDIPPSMQKFAVAYNMNLANVVELNNYDPNGLKGVTPTELRKFYGQDIIPESLKNKKADGPVTEKQMFKTFDEGLSKLTEVLSRDVPDMNAPLDTSTIVGKITGTEGTGNNPNSSAEGTGQFIDSTWKAMVKKYRPDLAAGKTDAEIISLKKTDHSLGKEMTQKYAEENSTKLVKAGHPATARNVYAMHFFGPKDAIKVLNSDPNVPIENVIDRDSYNANKQLHGKSVGEALAWADYFIHRNDKKKRK